MESVCQGCRRKLVELHFSMFGEQQHNDLYDNMVILCPFSQEEFATNKAETKEGASSTEHQQDASIKPVVKVVRPPPANPSSSSFTGILETEKRIHQMWAGGLTIQEALGAPICFRCARRFQEKLKHFEEEVVGRKEHYERCWKWMLAEESPTHSQDFSESLPDVCELSLMEELKELEQEELEILAQIETESKLEENLQHELSALKQVESNEIVPKEEEYWCRYNQIASDVMHAVDERDGLRAQVAVRQAQATPARQHGSLAHACLRLLHTRACISLPVTHAHSLTRFLMTQWREAEIDRVGRLKVFDELFKIGHTGQIATINGLRLGTLNEQRVESPEISAAWGEATFLLFTLSKRLQYSFKRYFPFPLGAKSKMTKASDKSTYPLCPNRSNFLNFLFVDSKYHEAMVGFLCCVWELEHHLQSTYPNFELKYRISGDKIGGLSITRAEEDPPRWTKALTYLLFDLKILLAWTSSSSS
eukprot:TRINITY_DN3039_c0_g1_i8.p1 TRINITY_DN3039_c0_g1~~TRINITY_DN3039_c0_g1_i8.p1  ORF type:complete len:478 (-),score=96.48 TRINITY_DN3039_c0_g1_i8:64-1497(-)